mmetsp:Transcript_94304/g.256047  ORF Transcript_94304/g.256047 Transcript_94304/m.256047 type:complete len:218 (+) Transcript_94304:348-1001(+)
MRSSVLPRCCRDTLSASSPPVGAGRTRATWSGSSVSSGRTAFRSTPSSPTSSGSRPRRTTRLSLARASTGTRTSASTRPCSTTSRARRGTTAMTSAYISEPFGSRASGTPSSSSRPRTVGGSWTAANRPARTRQSGTTHTPRDATSISPSRRRETGTPSRWRLSTRRGRASGGTTRARPTTSPTTGGTRRRCRPWRRWTPASASTPSTARGRRAWPA